MARKTFTKDQPVKIKMLWGDWRDAVYVGSGSGPFKTSKTRHYARTPDGKEHLVWPNEIRSIADHESKTRRGA